MKNTKKVSVLLVLLAVLLALSACASSDTSDTTPTTAPTDPPVDTTVPTEPEETEPVETQPQSREPEGTPLTLQELGRIHWRMAEDKEGWYEAALAVPFADPLEVNCLYLVGNGAPNGPRTPSELTPEEETYLKQFKESPTEYSVCRIPRETLENVLCTYFPLTEEDLPLAGAQSLVYYEATDCYYAWLTGTETILPVFSEGYRMPDGTIVLYYMDAFEDPAILRRAVLQEDPEYRVPYLVLEVTIAEP